MNIRDQLPKYLGEVKLLTTKCCIMECEKLGSEIFGATVILKQFGIHKCGHDSEVNICLFTFYLFPGNQLFVYLFSFFSCFFTIY